MLIIVETDLDLLPVLEILEEMIVINFSKCTDTQTNRPSLRRQDSLWLLVMMIILITVVTMQ